MRRIAAIIISMIFILSYSMGSVFAEENEVVELDFSTEAQAVELAFLFDDLSNVRTSEGVYDIVDGKLVGTTDDAMKGYAVFDELAKAYSRNFIYEADIKLVSGMAGMVIREGYDFEDPELDLLDWESDFVDKSYTLLIMDGEIKLVKYPNVEELGSAYLDTVEEHHYMISAYGDEIKVFVDDQAEPVIDITDPEYTSGNIGLLVTGIDENGESEFDNIRIHSYADKDVYLDMNIQQQAKILNFFSNDLSVAEIRVSEGVYDIQNGKLIGEIGGDAVSGYAVFDDIAKDFSQDFIYEVDAKLVNGIGGIVFREGTDFSILPLLDWQSDFIDKSYTLLITDEKIKLVRFPFEELGEYSMNTAIEHHYKISAYGDQIKVYVDSMEMPVIEVTDAEYEKGNLGLLVHGIGDSGKVEFDNVRIQDYAMTDNNSQEYEENGQTDENPPTGDSGVLPFVFSAAASAAVLLKKKKH